VLKSLFGPNASEEERARELRKLNEALRKRSQKTKEQAASDPDQRDAQKLE
jgi:hypothetical protein